MRPIAAGTILYRTKEGAVLQADGRFFPIEADWDSLIASENLASFLRGRATERERADPLGEPDALLPPIGAQEVWAAGVTYFRSRDARMEEAEVGGGGDFYDKVYTADRPELFLKATPHRVVGHGQDVRIRSDSKWNVPEPELTLVVSPGGKIQGYTIGNDMSSRDIEGENPLYLPQAKVYDGCCALGPGILVAEEPLPAETEIRIEIERGGEIVFRGATSVSEIKRSFEELVSYLYRDNSFPNGCFLMTGTGIVPDSPFTLEQSDRISIAVDLIGTLTNRVQL